jgi:hypothetical protein
VAVVPLSDYGVKRSERIIANVLLVMVMRFG